MHMQTMAEVLKHLHFLKLPTRASSGAGPNLSMVPSKSKNYEIGLKAFITSNTRVNVALFKVDTKNEIVVIDNSDLRMYTIQG